MGKLMFKRNLRILIIQAATLVSFFFVGWKVIHYEPKPPNDVHTYLSTISSDIVISSQKEALSLSTNSWADLIAIRSTVPLELATPIIDQIKDGIPIYNIQWGTINSEMIKTVLYRKELLQDYPYYEPGRFCFPVADYTWYTDTYGANREGGKRSHEGTDLFSPEGTPIVSVCEGIVEKAGWNRLGGERVGIRGFDGNYYYYAHLKDIAPHIKIGNKVSKGELIGTMGHTGDALTTPDHLHFGIELRGGQWINPYSFLRVWEQNSIDN